MHAHTHITVEHIRALKQNCSLNVNVPRLTHRSSDLSTSLALSSTALLRPVRVLYNVNAASSPSSLKSPTSKQRSQSPPTSPT